MYYLFDLLIFLRNIIQHGCALIPISMEKLHIRYIHLFRSCGIFASDIEIAGNIVIDSIK